MVLAAHVTSVSDKDLASAGRSIDPRHSCFAFPANSNGRDGSAVWLRSTQTFDPHASRRVDHTLFPAPVRSSR